MSTTALMAPLCRPLIGWARHRMWRKEISGGIMSLQTTHSATSQSTDEAAVRALYQQMMHGWNQGSGEAFAAVFAEDGDLIGFDGTHLKGRQEIARFH
jgi:SnoaL-like domain